MKPDDSNKNTYPLSPDTPLEVEMIIVEGMRNWTPAQRLAKMAGMIESAHSIVFSSVRRQYPMATDEQIRMRVASRLLSAEEMSSAFNWVAEEVA